MNSIKNHKVVLNIKRWIRLHKKTAALISIVTLVSIGVTFYVLISQKPKTNNSGKKPEAAKVEKKKYYSPLTGNLVKDEAATKMAVTGMMIENSENARPQSGLKNSGVVFEAIAEGGITRFLVLYQQEKPQMIGPVRSLRLYDVEWLAAFDAGIGHVGGSAAALSEIRNGSYKDLDQFFNSGSYWRATNRYAPHNVYTSFDKIDALNTAKGYASSIFTGFTRTDGKVSKTLDATSINIDISSYLFNSTYVFDSTTNSYARSQAGEAHLDRELGQIKPNVVIAMYVDENTVLEDGNRENIVTIGSGEAVIFQNGTAVNATWHKASRLDQITFTDSSGNDIPLSRGQTWIAAVPGGTGSVSWK